MNFNFELILFYAIIICGFITLLDMIFWAKKRIAAHPNTPKNEIKMPIIIDYARSFFPVLIIIFLIRSFLYEPFRIPSGSLKPTLEIGDFIAVNKFDYGIRMPITHQMIYARGKPQRGDIIVFRWPPNPSVDFIKRVIGVPGDHISYVNKVLYINGEKMPQNLLGTSLEENEGKISNVELKEENLAGIKHQINQFTDKPDDDFRDIVVPAGMYFTMGDNRDDSMDSRFWGFVPDANIVGKASAVWMSWNSDHYSLRWKRIGTKIH